MASALRLLLPLLLAFTTPVFAQKTTQPQEMAKPGESTEPPPPHAAPAGTVEAMPLPVGGGVLVFGGTKGTGLELVKDLVALKEHVTVVTHSMPDDPTLKAMGVTVVGGNALDPDSLKNVFTDAPYRIVVSTIGAKKGEPSPDYDGNKNIIDGAKAAHIPRFVLVTMIGDGDSAPALPWPGRLIFKQAIADKSRAEDYLKASGLAYSIIRPGGLLDKAASGQAKLVTDPTAFSWIARVDLGKLIADCVRDDRTVNKVFTAYDPTRASILTYFKK